MMEEGKRKVVMMLLLFVNSQRRLRPSWDGSLEGLENNKFVEENSNAPINGLSPSLLHLS